MDDFYFIRVVYKDAFPIFLAHNLFVQFNRDVFRRQGKFLEKFEQVELF